MTILFFCNLKTSKLGAFEHLLLEIGRRLTSTGDRLVVFFGAPPAGPVPDALKAAGIAWGHIDGWAGEQSRIRQWRFVRPALLAIRKHKPDLIAVHFGNEFPTLLAALMSKWIWGSRPLWVWHQRQQIVPPSFLKRRFSRIRLLGAAVDHYVVSYDGGRESLLQRSVCPSRISRIYNGVAFHEPSHPRGWLRRELNLPEDTILAVNVGWLVARKRIDITLRTFAGVARKVAKAVLLIVGEGPERSALESLATDLDVADRVRFLGMRSDVRDILAECDCLVHSSIAETCTNVVIESMAAGIPAVMMEAGAAREQIDDGVSGCVVGPDDELALSRQLELVLRGADGRRQMGRAARQRWKELFDLDHTAAEHCTLYRRLLGVKTLFFCNLIPNKMGTFEKLLGRIGEECRRNADEFVAVFSGEPTPVVAEMLRSRGVRWQVLRQWADGPGRERSWGFVFPALRLLRRERPDVAVVHFGNELPTVAAIALSRLLGMRSVKWVWQQDQQIRDPGPVARSLSRLRIVGAFVDRLVAVYEGGRDSFLKRNIPRDRITVIHNSVPPYSPARPPSWLREELGIRDDEVILVTVGSLIPRKRIDFLLRVCATMGGDTRREATGSSLPTWRLLVVGEGAERKSLELLAGQLGIADRVHFLGLRQDVREIMDVADIYLHASSAETCTYAVTESMAAGIPAVVLNAGAAREQIEDGMSGYVLEKADVVPFAACVRDLMTDKGKRESMGRMAQERWKSRFLLDAAAVKYQRLYHSLGVG